MGLSDLLQGSSNQTDTVMIRQLFIDPQRVGFGEIFPEVMTYYTEK